MRETSRPQAGHPDAILPAVGCRQLLTTISPDDDSCTNTPSGYRLNLGLNAVEPARSMAWSFGFSQLRAIGPGLRFDLTGPPELPAVLVDRTQQPS